MKLDKKPKLFCADKIVYHTFPYFVEFEKGHSARLIKFFINGECFRHEFPDQINYKYFAGWETIKKQLYNWMIETKTKIFCPGFVMKYTVDESENDICKVYAHGHTFFVKLKDKETVIGIIGGKNE